MTRFLLALALAGAGCGPVAPVLPNPNEAQIQATRTMSAKLAVATKEALTLAVAARRTAETAYTQGLISRDVMQTINSAAIVVSDKAQAFIAIAETITVEASLKATARELLHLFDGFIASLTAGNQTGAAIRAAMAVFVSYLGVQ